MESQQLDTLRKAALEQMELIDKARKAQADAKGHESNAFLALSKIRLQSSQTPEDASRAIDCFLSLY
jgi:hypothetical protein